MKRIDSKTYFDKVYGCWLGKCIAGNIGAPYEGMKQYLDLTYDPVLLRDMIPNDDLDLQLLWLEVLEERGLDFDSDDLAEIFVERCPYAPGEYAYFKKNFESGIHPPLSGRFNNEVYHDGMGCAIRSEIWACVCPGNPKLAVELCGRDGALDHCGDGLYAERFLAALEASAFFEDDLGKLIEDSLRFVPEGSRLRRLVEDVVHWCAEDVDLKKIRNRILREYGSAEATSIFQNLGFILAGLLVKSGDFLDMTMEICNCGFDTDCTCATAGAIFGILKGAENILAKHPFGEMNYQLGVTAHRRSDLVRDLARDVCRVGETLSLSGKNACEIANSQTVPLSFQKGRTLGFVVVYERDLPVVCFGGTRGLVLEVENRTDVPVDLPCRFRVPAPLRLSGGVDRLKLGGRERRRLSLAVSVPEEAEVLPLSNVLELDCGEQKFRFGLRGEMRWTLFGPYWRNSTEVPKLVCGESYWKYFPAKSESRQMDLIRFYHTNCLPGELSLPMKDFSEGKVPDPGDAADEGLGIDVPVDAFCVEDYNGFDGQARYVLVTRFLSDEEKTLGMQAGFMQPTELWLNGERIAAEEEVRRFTPENVHCLGIKVQKGVNILAVKLTKLGDRTRFSFNFLEGSACSNHRTDFLTVK